MIEKKLRPWLLVVVLLTLALVLTGCGSSSSRAALTGASWPGIMASENVIYVAYGNQVYAIDPETAQKTWTFSPAPQGGGLALFRSPTPTFYAHPAVGEDLVVVGDYIQTLYALDPMTGREVWKYSTDRARFIGGAAIADGVVYAGVVDGTFYALDAANGAELWTFKTERDIWSTPVVAEGVVYVTSLDHNLYALDAASGDLLWEYHAGSAIAGTPTLHEGVLYFGAFDNTVYALDTVTHELRWTYQTDNWMWDGPVVTDSILVGGDLDGNIFAIRLDDGTEVWTFETGGPVVGTPALGELVEDNETVPVVYVTSEDSYIYTLNVNNGQVVRPKVQITAEFTSRFLFVNTGTSERQIPLYAAPVLLDDVLLIGANQGSVLLYALDADSLLQRWTVEP